MKFKDFDKKAKRKVRLLTLAGAAFGVLSAGVVVKRANKEITFPIIRDSITTYKVKTHLYSSNGSEHSNDGEYYTARELKDLGVNSLEFDLITPYGSEVVMPLEDDQSKESGITGRKAIINSYHADDLTDLQIIEAQKNFKENNLEDIISICDDCNSYSKELSDAIFAINGSNGDEAFYQLCTKTVDLEDTDQQKQTATENKMDNYILLIGALSGAVAFQLACLDVKTEEASKEAYQKVIKFKK